TTTSSSPGTGTRWNPTSSNRSTTRPAWAWCARTPSPAGRRPPTSSTSRPAGDGATPAWRRATLDATPCTGCGEGWMVKLLVIEDDVKIAMAVRRGLEAEGDTVDVAVDGDDGLWRATEAQHDLIVLDLLLPKRNGFQICTELRR